MITKPGETSVALYRYALPDKVVLPSVFVPASNVSLFVLKQSGAIRTKIRASLKLPDNLSIVHTVPLDGITREADNELIYRGDLTHDISIGAVFDR